MFADSYWLTISSIIGIDLVCGVSDQNYRFTVLKSHVKALSRSSLALKHSFEKCNHYYNCDWILVNRLKCHIWPIPFYLLS